MYVQLFEFLILIQLIIVDSVREKNLKNVSLKVLQIFKIDCYYHAHTLLFNSLLFQF